MMPITHDFFLEIAKSSIESAGEKWTRNAISRAYYHMFHTTLELIGDSNNIPSKDEQGQKLAGGTHQRFCDYLCDGRAARDFDLDLTLTKEAGLKLKGAHHRRVIADYKLNKHINRIDAISIITDAENQITKVSNILALKNTQSDIA
ncbi:hypothetical protein WKH22_03255 [Pantoea agglomerans]|uniref:hypothetical protein n=1 Tax=Enterobacter agglomerans TaxID=549 RepID=UPI003C7AED65